ncbi:MAG TPA: cobalamin-binding protein [Chloroflexota bacterium]|jgi:iron complex transport system substrate-binding protein|nr:cobalamin-binding protein [Chloroflexota bacterium]
MKVVSLLPSATEIVFSLGLGNQLVGVTHECDYPPEALAKPRVTSTALPAAARSSGQIDAGINALLDAGESIYHLDVDLLESLQPDLILTQELCDVCAVAYSEVNRAALAISSEPRVVSLEPTGIEEVLASILTVGSLCGVTAQADALVASLRGRLERLQAAAPAKHKRVWCAEWLDPPMRAGHWVPEQVQLAGGVETFGRRGEPSVKCTWDEVRAYAPEVVVLMPCGFDLERTIEEAALLPSDLRTSAEVWAVNGSAYFSRPGPRLVDGVEIVGHVLGTYGGRLPADSLRRIA